ncbi:MAG: DUF3047 domain-containing protein, partial [Deltaproteobacteria bacterium]|nr:DUF3047 domain-containing protein [Deltaproteobacteria bacterium]
PCIVGFDSDAWEGGAPQGWELTINAGKANLSLEKTDGTVALLLKSDSASAFGISRKVNVDPAAHPVLRWKWRVDKRPPGDVRSFRTDDQAAQLYVLFREVSWPAKLNSPVIGYIWDDGSPKGAAVKSPQPLAMMVRYIVLRDKRDPLRTWMEEERNVLDDYRRLFPDIEDAKIRPVVGLSIYINSHHTGSEAESRIADIRFLPSGK